jgi:hypothetical protein
MGTALMPGNVRHRSTGAPGEAPSETLAGALERVRIHKDRSYGWYTASISWMSEHSSGGWTPNCVSSSEIHVRTDWIEGFFCATVYRMAIHIVCNPYRGCSNGAQDADGTYPRTRQTMTTLSRPNLPATTVPSEASLKIKEL